MPPGSAVGGALRDLPAIAVDQTGKALPGLLVALAVALATRYGSIGIPASSVLIALLGGIVLAPLAERSDHMALGVTVGGRDVMRIGVALLGAQITLDRLVVFGPGPLLLAIAALGAALVVGFGLARMLGLPRELSWLSAGAVAICGASAALAIAAVMPNSARSEGNVVVTVAGITAIGMKVTLNTLLTSGMRRFSR